jgi:hypothetical protein
LGVEEVGFFEGGSGDAGFSGGFFDERCGAVPDAEEGDVRWRGIGCARLQGGEEEGEEDTENGEKFGHSLKI